MCKVTALLLIGIMLSSIGSAAEQAVKGKVKSIDTTKNSIKVDEIELDVTRKTKITVDGKKAALADIKSGQEASVTYDDSLEAAISIVVGKEAEKGEEATAKAMKSLQGEWLGVAAEEAGEKFDKRTVKEQDRRVTIKGNTFTMKRTKNGTRGTFVGKFEIDASTGHFDFIGKGPAGNVNEWTGIYELEDDSFKLCYRYKKNDEAVRPKEFKAGSDKTDGAAAYTFKRDKE